MPKPIRLAFIGTGHMGQVAHLANYAGLPDVEIHALAEGRPELAQRIAERYGVKRVFPDHRSLLAEAGKDLDAVVAIMGFALHHAVVPDILAAGKPVLTEKSIAVQPATAQRLVETAQSKKLLYYVGYMKRCDPGVQYLRRKAAALRASGEAGALRYVRCTAAMTDWIWGNEGPIKTGEPIPAYEGEKPEPPPGWMSEDQGKRYIAFINFWSHQMNLMRYLLGEDYDLVRVSPCGLLVTAQSRAGVPLAFELNTHQIKRQWNERFTLCFEKAELEAELPAPLHKQTVARVRVTTEGPNGREDLRPDLGYGWSFAEQAKHFVACLRGEAEPLAPAADAVRDLELSEQYVRLLSEAKR